MSAVPTIGHPPVLRKEGGLPGQRTLLVLLAVLLIAFALRTYELNYTDIEGDEAFSYSFSIDTLDGIIQTTLNTAEPHPVGSYFLTHFWLLLAGDSEVAYRFPSAWFGVLSIAAIFRLGRRLKLGVGGSRDLVPAIAAILLALSPFLVQESRNGRMYSMSVCLTLISTWLALELLAIPIRASSRNRAGIIGLLKSSLSPRVIKYLVAYVLISWYALNVHYFTGTILVAQNVFVLAQTLLTRFEVQKPRLVRWVIAECAVLLGFAPWFLLVRAILHDYPGYGYYSPAIDWIVKTMAGIFIVGQNAPQVSAIFALIACIIFVWAVIRLVCINSQQRWAAFLLAVYVIVPFLIAYFDSRGRATFAERQVIATSGGFYLLIAAGIAPLAINGAKWLRRFSQTYVPGLLALAMGAGLLIGLRGYYLDQKDRPSSWRPFIRIAERYSANVTAAQLRVGQNYPEPAISFYYKGQPFGFTLPNRANDLEGSQQVVKEWADSGVERVILREDAWSWWNGGHATDVAQTALSTQFSKATQVFTGRWWVMIYSRMVISDLTPISVKFSDGLELQSAATRSLTPLHASIPEKFLEVYLHWQGDSHLLKGTEKLFIHITSQSGQVPSQLDVALTPQDIQTPVKMYSVPLADSLPPGIYTVRAGIYDPGQTSAPRLKTDTSDDAVQIGTLTIDQ